MESHSIDSQRVAIVTGASKGFGRAQAEVLLRAGWIVVGDGREERAIRKVDSENLASQNLHMLRGDITDHTHLLELVTTARALGSLQLLVNNAGALGPTPLPSVANLVTGDLESLFRVNVIAPMKLIQIALPTLIKENGTIVNISSDAAIEPYPGWGAYGSTKAALDKLTATLAVECSTIRIYSLDPGDMRTDMHQAAFPGEDISDRPDPSVSAPSILKLTEATLPSGRYRAKDLLA